VSFDDLVTAYREDVTAASVAAFSAPVVQTLRLTMLDSGQHFAVRGPVTAFTQRAHTQILRRLADHLGIDRTLAKVSLLYRYSNRATTS
jgi:hypothetical protein